MKKPASGINAVVQKLQRGVSRVDLENEHDGESGDEHEPGAGEEGEDDECSKRDKSKGQKYKQMKNELPDFVIDLVEKESLKKGSPREFKTLVINRLFQRSSSGKLVLNLDDALFSEHKKLYTKRYAREEANALPESIMKGLYFHNDQNAMDTAKRNGDIQPVDTGDGKIFWAFNSYLKGKEVASVETQELSSKKKVDKNQHRLLGEAFKNVGWTWDYKKGDVDKLANGKVIPGAIQNLIKQATESQMKLSKEAMTLIKSWPGDVSDDRLTKLKKGHNDCQKNLTKLQYIKDFKELPDDMEATKENLDTLMSNLATQTSNLNELIETTRGFVRAKKN